MSTVTASIAAPVGATRASDPWIESRRFDVSVFMLSPLLGLLVLFASGGSSRSLAPLLAVTLIGFPHYFSTFAFYFWDENKKHHAAHWLSFFGMPLAIVAATVVMFKIPFAIAVVTYFWNAFHVSRQSCGILSMYRHRAGRSTPADKTVANAAIIFTNLWFALWQTETYPTLHRFLNLPGPNGARILWTGVGVLALVSCARLVWNLIRRTREGFAPTSAELLFLATSIALFHPYLWVKDSALATIGMLVGHFIQYLGIVWLLHRRKYAPQAATGLLERLSVSTPLLLASIGATGLLTLGTFAAIHTFGRESIFEVMYMSLAFVHFYLDSLFWAFRDPHVRATVGPYFAARARAAA